MGKWYYYTKLAAGLLSTTGASIMVVTAARSLRLKGKSASHILFWLAVSDFLFSCVGVVTSTFKVLEWKSELDSWWHSAFFAAPHWSFEIASFLWTGTLAFYIIQQNRNNFDLRIAHVIIWTATSLYLVVEIFALETKDERLIYAVRIIWDIVAILTLFNVILALMLFSRRLALSTTTTRGNSAVISRLLLYMVAFVVLVTPNIIKDVLFFADMVYPLYGGVASTMFALLPLANAVIYVMNASCLMCIRRKGKHINHSKADTILINANGASVVHELKGLQVGEKIGEGIAVVYKGKWRGAQVAVKMQSLSLEIGGDLFGFQDECNREIQQEASLMRSLSHPNIVLFMEAGFYNGSICIISEYCSRGSLRDVLESEESKNLVWPMKIRLAIGIAHGLQYLHTSTPPMIHRDLKSPNIVVDETWHAKIADFGTLRFSEIIYNKDSGAFRERLGSTQAMTGLVGTTRWMAPEVIVGEKIYNEKIDIYSLGIILWELIDGKLPFAEIRWNHTIEKVILQGKRPVIPAESCPPRWKVLITMCWQADPTQRPTVKQVLRSLQRVAREEIWESSQEEDKYTRLQTNLQSIDCDYILQNTACEADLNRISSVNASGRRILETPTEKNDHPYIRMQ